MRSAKASQGQLQLPHLPSHLQVAYFCPYFGHSNMELIQLRNTAYELCPSQSLSLTHTHSLHHLARYSHSQPTSRQQKSLVREHRMAPDLHPCRQAPPHFLQLTLVTALEGRSCPVPLAQSVLLLVPSLARPCFLSFFFSHIDLLLM